MRISVRHIKEVIAADFGIPAEQFNSHRRGKRIAHPRQYAMLLARELTPLSLTVIGNLFERDHTTIIHGIGAAKKRIEQDRNLALKVEARALLLKSEPKPILDTAAIGFSEMAA